MIKKSFFRTALLAGLLSYSSLFGNPGPSAIDKIESSSNTKFESTLSKKEIDSFDPLELERTTNSLNRLPYRDLDKIKIVSSENTRNFYEPSIHKIDRDVNVRGSYSPKKKIGSEQNVQNVKELVRFNDTYFSDRQIANLKIKDPNQFKKDIKDKARELGYDLNRVTIKEFMQFEADLMRKFVHYDWEQCVETTGIGADVNNDGRCDGIRLVPLSQALIENPSIARKLVDPDNYLEEVRRKKDVANKTPVDILFHNGRMDILCRHISSLAKNILEAVKDDNPNLSNVYSVLARNEDHAWNLFLVCSRERIYVVNVDLTRELIRKGDEYVIDYSKDDIPEIFSSGIYFALIADLYRTNNFPRDVRRITNQVSQETDAYDDILLFDASANIELGDLESAKNELIKIVKLRKNGFYSSRRYKALFDLAYVYRRLGDNLEEYKIYEKFIEDAKKQNKESTLPDALFYNVGENYFRRKDYKEAEKQFDFNLRKMSRYREENMIMLACSQLYTDKERATSTFHRYMNEFPNGQFVKEAREGLKESK